MSRIDIVIPCYNYSVFLRECVESVTRQSHQDLHILIIDDGSTDQTLGISMALSAADGRIEVRRHDSNRGHIETYNEGIAWTEGEYWLLLSPDDFLLPGALERAARALDEHPDIGLVYGAFAQYKMSRTLPFRTCRLSNRTAATKTLSEQADGTGQLTIWEAEELIAALVTGTHFGVSTAVARVETQKKLGGYLGELPHSGDLEMWLRFALRTKVAFIDSLQAVYRVHDRNMSKAYTGSADFWQRVRAFDLHSHDIAVSLPNGARISQLVRNRLMSRAIKLAVRSLPNARFDDFLALCEYLMRTQQRSVAR